MKPQKIILSGTSEKVLKELQSIAEANPGATITELIEQTPRAAKTPATSQRTGANTSKSN